MGYALAVLLVALGSVLKWGFLTEFGNDRPFLIVLGPTLVATWYGGTGPGLLAVVLSTAVLSTVPLLLHVAGAAGAPAVVQEVIFATEAIGGVALVSAARRWRTRSEASAKRLRDSYAFAAALGRARTVQEVAEIALDEVIESFGVTAGVGMALADGSGGPLRSFAQRANPWLAATGSAYTAMPLDSPSVVAVAGRTRSAVFVENEDQWKARFPGSYARFRQLASPGAFLSLPMVSRNRLVGVLLIAFRKARRFGPQDRAAWQVLARDCGKAIDRAQLFESTQRERSEVQEANRAKDEFLAAFSHELRAPLDAILGWAELLGRPKKVESAVFDRGVRAMHQNLQALGNLIDSLLGMWRSVAHELKVETRRVELSRLVRDGIAPLEAEAVARGVQLRQAAGLAQAQVIADGVRLQRAIRHLASSALRATRPGGHMRIETKVHERCAVVCIAYETGGAEPGGEARAPDGERTGASGEDDRAALEIATYIVEGHHGRVRVVPGKAGGMVISIEVPLAGAMTGTIGGGPVQGAKRPAFPLAGVRLLVVADDANEGDMLREMLTGRGAHVWEVHSAREALEELRVFTPQVIVSDLLAPDADPLGFIRDVRALQAPAATLPAVAMTNSLLEADVEAALAAGYTRILVRPAEPRGLTRAIVELREHAAAQGGQSADVREEGAG